MAPSSQIDARSINTIRTLAADVVQKSKSGHPGAPMGCAPMAHVLFSKFVKVLPLDPTWINRDRFVLSNGHACVLQYILWHLLGFNISMADLQNFRQYQSKTPGHPEANHGVDGIEVSTGPLGQGISNAVGLALASAHMAATFNRPGFRLIDNHTFVILGDGCLQEGVQAEAVALAGHLKLGNLIALYDDNHITIDGETDVSFTEDVLKRFESYGWHTQTVSDGDNDLESISNAIEAAKLVTDKPSIIKIRTTIGYGSLSQGEEKVHGAPLGDKDIEQLKPKLGFNASEKFVVPSEVYEHWKEVIAKNAAIHADWQKAFAAYSTAHPELAAELKRRLSGELPQNIRSLLPVYTLADSAVATRKLSEVVLNKICDALPELIGGSADLTGSNLTRWKTAVDFQHPSTKLGDYSGRYIRFGVREHGMAAVCNGIQAFGGLIPFGATFFNFITYAWGAVRLSALSKHQVLYIMTHDSIGLGEDGPTHQPIETLALLRATPNIQTLRPADGNEVSGCYLAALTAKNTPSVLILTRQNLPQLSGSSIEHTLKGAYVLSDSPKAKVVLVGTGSEVSLAVDTAKLLAQSGIESNVVSMPSWELFEAQPAAYKESVFPKGLPVVSMEAMSTLGWQKYAHYSCGIDTFGLSAPYLQAYKHVGLVPEAVAEKVVKVVKHYETNKPEWKSERESVKVVVRCRPFSDKEKSAGHSEVVKVDKANASVTVLDPRCETDPPKTFTYDSAFDSLCSQIEVYNTTARQIVDSVLQGYNGTIFAYGQTGTGKTFSMEGVRSVPELRGIIPNAFEHIFGHIKHAGAETKFLVRVSYLEIYNEEVRDLLNLNGQRLEIKERADIGVYVKDLSTFVVKDVEEIDRLMSSGNKNRSVGYTEMNATSSRSHSIFSITVEASEIGPDGQERIRAGKLHLVDLAGSERQGKTGATGDRLKEATKINLSLSALGNVISSLVDGKSSHIPYRDSKLTRLLQDSLGGNAKTLMIATMSPASYNYEETISTLRYASRAKNIKNKPKVNEDPKDAMLRQFQEEIKRLKQQLESEDGAMDGEEVVHEVEEIEEVAESEEENEEFALKTKNKKDKTKVSEEQLKVMQEMVSKEKHAILESKTLEESERNRLLEEAESRLKELEKETAARQELAAKLAQMEQKLLVGGVNIIDQHEQQALMLAKHMQELEEKARKERELHQHLLEHDETNLQIEEEFSNLQEEAQAKTKKIKKLWSLYSEQKAELKDLREEQQRERESLLETIRELTNELKYQTLVVSGFIPQNEQDLIEDCAEYDEMSEKWKIAHIAHAGNNIRGKKSLISGSIQQQTSNLHRDHVGDQDDEPEWDPMCIFPDVYLCYDVPGLKKKDIKKLTKSKESSKKSKPTSTLEASAVPQARGLLGKQKHYA